MVGVAGATGSTGATGPKGAVGATGARGGAWTSYRDVACDSNRSILSSESGTVSEIAGYLRQNPGQQIGIDGLNRTCADSVRNALLSAGVPSFQMQVGAFGNPQLRADRRVEVLVSAR